jgi:hypothetical protein
MKLVGQVACRREGNTYRIYLGSLRKIDHLEDIRVFERMILKSVLELVF